jgi:hypothetical protein
MDAIGSGNMILHEIERRFSSSMASCGLSRDGTAEDESYYLGKNIYTEMHVLWASRPPIPQTDPSFLESHLH